MKKASKTGSIKKACRIDDEIFSIIIRKLEEKTLKTEKDVEKLIRSEARKRKLKLAFPPVAGAGKNSANIHNKPKKSKLRGFLVIDFGVKVNGYCSDMTRTVHIGKASDDERNAYNLLLKAQKKGVSMLKPGADCFEIDYKLRKMLGSMRQYFLHPLGHGVGKKIHEAPSLSPRTGEKLKKGDIVTVEPGIYIKNKFGIRIEDSVLVGKKPEAITKSEKKLIEII